MAKYGHDRSRRLALPDQGEHGDGDRGLAQDAGRKGGAIMTVIDCPNARRRRRPLPKYLGGPGSNMRTFLFRSSRLIVESNEADLIQDVGLALDRAQTKLGQS